MYLVYGWDRGTEDTYILYETDTKSLAIDWAKRYCSKENMGGWDKVYVSYRYQVDVDWDGEPVTEEQIIWSCWNEPMDKVIGWSDNAYEEF